MWWYIWANVLNFVVEGGAQTMDATCEQCLTYAKFLFLKNVLPVEVPEHAFLKLRGHNIDFFI